MVTHNGGAQKLPDQSKLSFSDIRGRLSLGHRLIGPDGFYSTFGRNPFSFAAWRRLHFFAHRNHNELFADFGSRLGFLLCD